jgi:hypothetical protein
MEDERDMARGAALSELNRVHIHPEYLAGPMAESSSAAREREWEELRLNGATGADFGFAEDVGPQRYLVRSPFPKFFFRPLALGGI